uniref:Uncharacterized protein n=1 Tax=Rhizophora mucronata TaxID=61149 RepID=A0A2P2ISJ2_RHIMU
MYIRLFLRPIRVPHGTPFFPSYLPTLYPSLDSFVLYMDQSVVFLFYFISVRDGKKYLNSECYLVRKLSSNDTVRVEDEKVDSSIFG